MDDVLGWDFAFDSPDVDCHVFDGMDKSRIGAYWHSLGPMGIIGAKGNNGIGVAGINWDVSMMLLKIGAQGIGRGEKDLVRIDRAARAIHYAADNGARIINWSGFVDDARPEKLAELRAAIDYAANKDVLVVVSAGNDAEDLDKNNNCSHVHAPQCFEGDNLMKVAEIDFGGNLYVAKGRWVGGSNYGCETSRYRSDWNELHDSYRRWCGYLWSGQRYFMCCSSCVRGGRPHAISESEIKGSATEKPAASVGYEAPLTEEQSCRRRNGQRVSSCPGS